MLSRSIGAILRGKGTPYQFFVACLLGAAIGFVPASQGLGLVVALSLLLATLNANLFLAFACGLLGKVLAFAFTPVLFHVGRFLLDGPTRPVFKGLINAPVTALMGFEYYVVTGGLALGLLTGAICGAAVVMIVGGFRRRLAALEASSERYLALTSKWFVKLALFVFVGGGKGQLTYADLLGKRVGNPVRPLGVVLAVLIVGLFVMAKALFSDQILSAFLVRGLERANGATVDVESVSVDLANGSLSITGLAMADPEALDTDLLRAAKVEGKINAANLLRKRVHVDRLVLVDATSGEKRKTKGRVVGWPKIPLPDPHTAGTKLEEYLADAKVWKARLDQANDWLRYFKGPPKEEKPESLRERLEREIQRSGYADVAARHLVDQTPTFTLSRLTAEKVRTDHVKGTTLDVSAFNLSTQPALLAGAPRISIKSADGTLLIDVSLAELSADGAAGNAVKLTFNDLPMSSVSSRVRAGGAPPVEGGKLDVSTDGTWHSDGRIRLPLNVTLRNTRISVAGSAGTPVDKLLLPIEVSGTLSHPRVSVDDKALQSALVAAGANELANRLASKALGNNPAAATAVQGVQGALKGDPNALTATGTTLAKDLFAGKKEKDEDKPKAPQPAKPKPKTRPAK